MKIKQPTESNLFETVLTEKELEMVSAGGTKDAPKKPEGPRESLSLNFSEIKFTYTSQ